VYLLLYSKIFLSDSFDYWIYNTIIFTLLSFFGLLSYKILKLKLPFKIKDTEPKYYIGCIMLILFGVFGDFIVTTPSPPRPPNLLIILIFPVLVAFAEEFITKVVLLQTLSKAFGFTIALFAQAIIFAFFHFDFRISAMIYFFIYGVGGGLLMNPKKGNFLYPFIAHYSVDFILFLKIYLLT
jgi:membrane protease YdiL (CAAX protease family)